MTMRETIQKALPSRSRGAESPITSHDAWGSLRAHAVHRAHEALDEVPGVLRRLKTFLLVGSITMAAFAAAMVAVLWRAAH
jgi:hypothetical protein